MGAATRIETAAGPAIIADRVLTSGSLDFVARLEERFGSRRREVLSERAERRARIAAGEQLGFPEETAEQRASDWRVPPAPADLEDRRVEITGPVELKMMINALNSGARVFMADLEDSLTPTWGNVLAGQANLMDAVAGTASLATDERVYELADRTATLVVRPRGWHLDESHVTLDGRPISAGLFDFGLYLFHNAAALLAAGSGPYLYLPKLEGRREARLWHDVFAWAGNELALDPGSIRATARVEAIPAA